MMRTLLLSLPLLFGGFSDAAIARDSHALFSELLTQYVHDGRVNYRELKNDARLQQYLEQLANSSPARLEDNLEQLAFWLNAYNAYTLKIICDNYPVESINDLHQGGLIVGTLIKRTIWDRPFVVIDEHRLTLNQIEHKIIRPGFKDPRIHFALVCAAVSCPSLRSEAYEGYKLDQQLTEQGRLFFEQRDKNFFELQSGTAHLSKILDWYGKDFGKGKAGILLYISRFLPDDLAEAIRTNPKAWRIEHTQYNWRLNE